MRGVQLFEQLQPQSVGQAHVGDEQIELLAAQQGTGTFHILGRENLVAGAHEGDLVERAQIGLVIDHEDAGSGHVHEAESSLREGQKKDEAGPAGPTGAGPAVGDPWAGMSRWKALPSPSGSPLSGRCGVCASTSRW